MMKVTLGKDGLKNTWQAEFREVTKCCYCKGTARIGFVAHEGMADRVPNRSVASLHKNEGVGGFWLHDCCAVAVYFCKECFKATALWNQG